MPNQKRMTLHLADPKTVSVGDVVQCPRCCEKYVVLPEYLKGHGWVVCPSCGSATDIQYHVAVIRMNLELPPRASQKEARTNGKKRPRKRIP